MTAATDRSSARPATSSAASTLRRGTQRIRSQARATSSTSSSRPRVPGTQRPTGTTYGTIVPGTASQGSIYFTKTENGGRTWSPLTRIDPQLKGNQFYPDIDANAGKLHVVWQDTRVDTATGPDGHWSTVPVREPAHRRTRQEPPRARRGVQSFYSSSANGGDVLDDAARVVGRVQAELGAVRQPRHPVLRGLQLHLRGRVEGADDLGGRPGHRAGNRPALHERRRHGRLRRLPDPSLLRHATDVRRRHDAERRRARPEHLGAGRSGNPSRTSGQRKRAGFAGPLPNPRKVERRRRDFSRLTSSRPCRPCRACRRLRRPSRAPRRRSPRSSGCSSRSTRRSAAPNG